MNPELVSKIEQIGDGVLDLGRKHEAEIASLKKEHTDALAALREDVFEELASRNKQRDTFGGGRRAAPYAVHFGPNGTKSYLVKGNQRLADVTELRKAEPVSMERWAAALVLGDACNDKDACEFVAEQKSVTSGSTGVLIPAGYVAQWIDMARAQSVLSRAGMRTITMPEATLSYMHQTADPTFSWRSSEGASLSATDPTFALRQLSAKTIAVRTQVSLEASMDVANIGEQITRAYTAAFGAAIDLAGIRGTSPAPTGLQTLSGVGAVASGGAQSDYDKIVDAVAAFMNANNALEQLTGIISHPNMVARYNKIKTGLSGDKTVLVKPPIIANVPWYATTNNDVFPASPQSYMIELGNFDDLVCGVRLNPMIRILDGTASMATNLLVEIVGVARVDILAVRPASFVRITGLSAS
jgi:HK97 family phage major capsid protein